MKEYKIRQYINTMDNYKGLVNEGSTCYLNSLLQTLFMTHQFRKNVYSYMHDPKKIKEKDSIPYQLQKLFVQLQLKEKTVYTKHLLKSFQWNQVDSFQQHDVQQFCRILFEAIEKAHKNSTWIKDLFGGSTASFINCGKHISKRSEMFLDISLPIRNPYKNINYNTLEECLYEYLRPEQLDDKFQCDQCGEKVTVQKGLEIQSLPPILTIQLNRFQLNYQNLQREKINSFLYFPEILEMHRFTKSFSNIEVKPIPQKLKEKTVVKEKQKSARTINFDMNPPVAKKTKRKNSDDIESKKQKVTFLDEEGKDKRIKQLKGLSVEEEKQKNKEILASLKSQKSTIDKRVQKIKPKEQDDLQNDMLFGGGGLGQGNSWNSGSFGKPQFQKTQTSYQHEQQSFDMMKQYPSLTYALYAVLVHSGGAYGGHYYAYISDGENWYKFDDNTVTKVTKFDMRKYGNNSLTSHGANAYLLFYQDVKLFKQVKDIQIPQQLLDKIKKQEEAIKQANLKQPESTSKRNFAKLDLTVGLLVHLYDNQSQIATIQIFNREEETLEELRLKVKQEVKIEQKEENWRLRRYNKVENTMHQIYGIDFNSCTLEELGFRQLIHLTVEYKKDQEVFEDYDPKKITIKINVWQPDIIMISQKKLRPFKVQISEEATFAQLYELIKKKVAITENFLIIRRNFSIGNPLTKLDVTAIGNLQLIGLRFFNSINLYVEEYDPKEYLNEVSSKTKWGLEFQAERFRCLIKFNNPKIGQSRDQEIYFDTRKTLGDLKNCLSTLIGLSVDNFRIKKTKQSLSEMTTYKKKLSQLKFINNEILFLEEGKSSKGSVIIKRAEVSLIDDKIEFTLFEEIQFEIEADLVSVQDLINKIALAYSLSAELIRLREYKCYEFKEIFAKTDLIQRIREKSLVWQRITEEVPRGTQLYSRVFDVMTFELSPLKQLYIETAASYEELALLIEEETKIPSDKVLIWKPLSNYIEKENLIDCEWIEVKFLSKTAREEPLLINTDGEIIIIKEAEESYKAKPNKVYQVGNDQKKNNKENQLKITVVQEMEEFQNYEHLLNEKVVQQEVSKKEEVKNQ